MLGILNIMLVTKQERCLHSVVVKPQREHQSLYFQWSAPWYLFVIADISSGKMYGIIFWHSILAYCLLFWLSKLALYSDVLFWHSIWYIFGNSSWLRSLSEHRDLALAVEVRRRWRRRPPGHAKTHRTFSSMSAIDIDINMYMYSYMYIRTCTYIYIYIYMYTLAHMHMPMHV